METEPRVTKLTDHKIIGWFKVSNNKDERIFLSLQPFKGQQYVHARLFWPKQTNEGRVWTPSRKGICVQIGDWLPFFSLLQRCNEYITGKPD
jgi:hypothetical protein